MLEDYFFTKNTRYVLWGAFAIIVALLIFHAGIVIGSHQSMRRGSGERPPGMLDGIMPNEAFIGDHGAVGTIATVTLPSFILSTRGGISQLIETSTSTTITGGPTGSVSDLTRGETVIIIGDPRENDIDSQGDLDARLIKIIPPPPGQGSTSMNVIYIKRP